MIYDSFHITVEHDCFPAFIKDFQLHIKPQISSFKVPVLISFDFFEKAYLIEEFITKSLNEYIVVYNSYTQVLYCEFFEDKKNYFSNLNSVETAQKEYLTSFWGASSAINIKIKEYKNLNENSCIVNNKKMSIEQILDEFVFCPRISRKMQDYYDYKSELAKMCLRWNCNCNETKREIEILSKQNLGYKMEVDNIFDSDTGGILFQDFEWQLINDKNELKRIFDTRKNGGLIYSLEKEQTKLLRGSEIYYYFACEKYEYELSKPNLVRRWIKKNQIFIKQIIHALDKFEIINEYDRRLLLGVLDNYRNFLLVILNCIVSIECKEERSKPAIIALKDTSASERVKICKELISENIRLMLNLTGFVYSEANIIGMARQLTEKILNYIIEYIVPITLEDYQDELNDFFRIHRDLDNFYEIYAAVKFAVANSDLTKYKHINILGILYGGIEIPFVLKELIEIDSVIYFVKLPGNYKNRHCENLKYFSLNFKDPSGSIGLINACNILCDDNIGTGATLQILLNSLAEYKYPVNKIIAIRHPNLNRYVQFRDYNRSFNLRYVDSMCLGLLFKSPYTKIESSKYDEDYNDVFGAFSIPADIYLRYLKKNGIYKKESDVDKYGYELRISKNCSI